MTRAEMRILAEMIAENMKQATDVILTGKQCAELLGITENALRVRTQRGQVPYHKVGSNVYYSRREVTEYYLSKDSAISAV